MDLKQIMTGKNPQSLMLEQTRGLKAKWEKTGLLEGAGSLDAQHILRSVCGLRYVCVQGAMHKVSGFGSVGVCVIVIVVDHGCKFGCKVCKILSAFTI